MKKSFITSGTGLARFLKFQQQKQEVFYRNDPKFSDR